MFIKDVMTANVVTISSDTSLSEAKRVMQAHRFKRLPVVDKGRLMGVVTENRLEHISPEKATSLTLWEVGFLLEKTPVARIMEKNVVTVEPEMTVEEGLAIAQKNRVGALVVVEGGKNGQVVGIATTNDFFYSIANKVLGIGEPGSRVHVEKGGEAGALEKIMAAVVSCGMSLTTVHIITNAPGAAKDVVIHLAENEPACLVKALDAAGFSSAVRKR